MTDFSPTYCRALASVLLDNPSGKHLEEAARILVDLANARESGMSLVDFAREGQPPQAGRVIPFKPFGRVPMPARGREAFEPEDCA